MQPSEDIIADPVREELRIERLSADNLADLAKLHGRINKTQPSYEYFQKKYDPVFPEIGPLGFLAYGKEDEPVGFAGAIPCIITYQNEKMLAAQSSDVLVLPGRSYKGLFPFLSTQLFQLCKANGIQLVFGFPNRNSLPGAIKRVGYVKSHCMKGFVLYRRRYTIASMVNRLPFGKTILTRYQNKVLARMRVRMPGIQNSVLADGFAGIDRTDAFLQYKSYSAPFVLKVEGVSCWMSNRNHNLIGDMEGLTENNVSAFKDKIRKLAARAGMHSLQFHCSPDTSLFKLMETHFPSFDSYPVLFMDLGSTIPTSLIRFTFADTDIF